MTTFQRILFGGAIAMACTCSPAPAETRTAGLTAFAARLMDLTTAPKAGPDSERRDPRTESGIRFARARSGLQFSGALSLGASIAIAQLADETAYPTRAESEFFRTPAEGAIPNVLEMLPNWGHDLYQTHAIFRDLLSAYSGAPDSAADIPAKLTAPISAPEDMEVAVNDILSHAMKSAEEFRQTNLNEYAMRRLAVGARQVNDGSTMELVFAANQLAHTVKTERGKDGSLTAPEAVAQLRGAIERTATGTNGNSSITPPPRMSICQPNLAYLAARLPNYNDPDLQSARQTILQTNIGDVIRRMNAQGHSTAQGARLLIEQGKQYEASCASARRTALTIAASLEGVRAALDAIDAGRPLPAGAPSFDHSVVGQALKEYVIASWGRLANRETAIQVVCHAHT